MPQDTEIQNLCYVRGERKKPSTMLKKIGIALIAILLILIASFLVFREGDVALETLMSTYAYDHSQFIDVDGTSIHYCIEGEGDHTLLLIHGTGASLHTWDGWTENMRDSLRIVRLDLPAFGLTGPSVDRDYTITTYVDILEAFVSKIGLDTFFIAGNSLGGNIAWNYALTYPDKVEKLILVDAAGYPSQESAPVFKLARSPITAPLFKHITPKSFIKKNLLEVYGSPQLLTDEVITRYHDLALREGNRQAFIDRVRTVYADRSPLIKNISCPTLIMWGEKDAWIDLKHADNFLNDIENSTSVTYPELGHVPMEEAPDKTANDALTFLMVQ